MAGGKWTQVTGKRRKLKLATTVKYGKIAQVVKKTLARQAEPKFKRNFPLLTGALADVYVCTPLNLIENGPDADDRIGKKITMTKLNLSGIVRTTAGPSTVYMQVIYDREANGALITQGDLYWYNTTPATNRIRNPHFLDRFQILKTWQFTIDASSTEGKDRKLINYSKKLNHITNYNTTAATIAAIQDGALHLCIWIDSGRSDSLVDFSYSLNYIDV